MVAKQAAHLTANKACSVGAKQEGPILKWEGLQNRLVQFHRMGKQQETSKQETSKDFQLFDSNIQKTKCEILLGMYSNEKLK